MKKFYKFFFIYETEGVSVEKEISRKVTSCQIIEKKIFDTNAFLWGSLELFVSMLEHNHFS